jgi:CBS domain containing-hemolysin-like protein
MEVWGKTFSPIKATSFLLAIASFTFLHVVIGELLPKSIAIRKARWQRPCCSPAPLHVFYKTFHWAIRVLNGTANWMLKKSSSIDPVSEGEHVHSADELALLVAESERAEEVTEIEREILINALELNELWVRDVMTPRQEVIVLDADQPFEKVARNRPAHQAHPLPAVPRAATSTTRSA